MNMWFVVVLTQMHSLTQWVILSTRKNSLLWRNPDCKVHWGQHGAHLGPVGPRWAPYWLHEPCYQGNCLCDWLYVVLTEFLLGYPPRGLPGCPLKTRVLLWDFERSPQSYWATSSEAETWLANQKVRKRSSRYGKYYPCWCRSVDNCKHGLSPIYTLYHHLG